MLIFSDIIINITHIHIHTHIIKYLFHFLRIEEDNLFTALVFCFFNHFETKLFEALRLLDFVRDISVFSALPSKSAPIKCSFLANTKTHSILCSLWHDLCRSFKESQQKINIFVLNQGRTVHRSEVIGNDRDKHNRIKRERKDRNKPLWTKIVWS